VPSLQTWLQGRAPRLGQLWCGEAFDRVEHANRLIILLWFGRRGVDRARGRRPGSAVLGSHTAGAPGRAGRRANEGGRPCAWHEACAMRVCRVLGAGGRCFMRSAAWEAVGRWAAGGARAQQRMRCAGMAACVRTSGRDKCGLGPMPGKPQWQRRIGNGWGSQDRCGGDAKRGVTSAAAQGRGWGGSLSASRAVWGAPGSRAALLLRLSHCQQGQRASRAPSPPAGAGRPAPS
jgi:hypothetical protein